MAKKLRKVLSLILVLVFLISTALLVRHMKDSADSTGTYEQAQQMAARPKEEKPVQKQPAELPDGSEAEAAEQPRKTYWAPAAVEADAFMRELEAINLDALREANADVVGWIFVPNTDINYPVMQGQDNQFYLRHDWLKKQSNFGSIFLESTNAADMKDFRTIVYGHSMENGTMFSSLHRYTEESYWEQYPYVYLVTDEGVLRYEIYSCYRAKVNSNTYALELDEFDEKNAFIQITLEESELETGIVPVETDRLLTLSTCVGHGEYRRVVHARLPMVEVEE